MQNEHWSCDRPAENDFIVTADTYVGEKAMCAFFDPINHVLTATRPEEAHANTEKSFVNSEVAADGAAVKDIENETAQG